MYSLSPVLFLFIAAVPPTPVSEPKLYVWLADPIVVTSNAVDRVFPYIWLSFITQTALPSTLISIPEPVPERKEVVTSAESIVLVFQLYAVDKLYCWSVPPPAV